jgi:toxin HigB-1
LSLYAVSLRVRCFKHRGLKRLYERHDPAEMPPDLADVVERILTALDAAHPPQALDVPPYRRRPLQGELKGRWSVTVRANGRIVFRFEGADAFEVESIDYQ